ncbi:MAG: hypothetical protein RI932_1890 [Pseudomonadota bacterium]|jgi:hypothetical protein
MKFWVSVSVFVPVVLFVSGCSVVIDSNPTKEPVSSSTTSKTSTDGTVVGSDLVPPPPGAVYVGTCRNSQRLNASGELAKFSREGKLSTCSDYFVNKEHSIPVQILQETVQATCLADRGEHSFNLPCSRPKSGIQSLVTNASGSGDNLYLRDTTSFSNLNSQDLIFVRNFAKALRSQASPGTAANSTDDLK